MVTATSISLPSLQRLTLSKRLTSPLAALARMVGSSCARSGGSRIAIGCPIISSAEYPNSRSAPGFQLVTTPSSVLEMIASSEESTMAARRAFWRSLFFRSLKSRMALETRVPASVTSGLKLISAGNSLPSFRRPNSSSPARIARRSGLRKYPARCAAWALLKRWGMSSSTGCPIISARA